MKLPLASVLIATETIERMVILPCICTGGISMDYIKSSLWTLDNRVSDGIMRQLLLWVHHDNNGIFTHNDIQLKFSHFSSQRIDLLL